MKYPHQDLIEKHEIKLKDLDKDLQDMIRLFNNKLAAYEIAEDKEDEEDIKKLKGELRSLSKEILEEIIEYLEEQELGEEEEEEKRPKDKEGILRYLYEKGITRATKEQLKEYGYPVGFWSGNGLPMKGETAGNYRLFRDNTNQPYQIIKIKK